MNSDSWISSRQNSLFVILILNAFVYTIIIFLYPGFYTDDFILFTIISQSPNNFFPLDPSYPFYLLLRPVSYFSFWLDYQLWGNSPYLIKLVSLFYHLALVYSLFRLIENMCNIFNIKLNYKICFISIFIFSFHLDVLYWNNWISDRTELLYLLFYTISINFFLKYHLNKNKNNLWLFLLFYILSAGAKQTGIHLPFILIFFFFFPLNSQKLHFDSNTILALTLAIVIFFVSFFINLHFAESPIYFNILWKKPFAIIGLIFHTLIPIFSQNIYNYFILNKYFALILLSGGFLLAGIFAKKTISKRTTQILLFIFIIGFPRMLTESSVRLNSIFLFWLTFFIYYYLSTFVKNKYKVLIISILVIIITSSFYYRVNSDLNIRESQARSILELQDLIKKDSSYLIIISEFPELIKYQLHYIRFHNFGVDINVQEFPFSKSISFDYYEPNRFNLSKIEVRRDDDFIDIKSYDPLVFINIDRKNKYFKKLLDLKLTAHQSGRGYKEIMFRMPKFREKYKLIYHDGKNWGFI